jgi:uncharacterized protein YkwD
MTRCRMLFIGALVACLLVPAAPAAAGTSAEVQMVRKVNAYRSNRGLPRVHLARSLMRSAERYSWRQLNSNYFGHSNRIQASSKYRRLGEILEYHRGMKARIDHAFRLWLNSSGHRAIIVDRNFRYAGAGRASGRFQGRNATIWTMHFGSK